MAFAPAAMVACMLSSLLPPLAMMGTSGNSARIFRTRSAVCGLAAAAEDRDIGAVDQRVADGGLRCKGVDREDQGFDASSVDHDAARLLAGSREAKQVAEGTVNLGRIWLDL